MNLVIQNALTGKTCNTSPFTVTIKHKLHVICITYHISWPIRRTFSPEKYDLNSTCILCTEGKYYFQTYKYLYIYYMKKVTHRVKTTMKMILLAVTTIFWVSMMNKLYYGC